jgi:hypothetical protein
VALDGKEMVSDRVGHFLVHCAVLHLFGFGDVGVMFYADYKTWTFVIKILLLFSREYIIILTRFQRLIVSTTGSFPPLDRFRHWIVSSTGLFPAPDCFQHRIVSSTGRPIQCGTHSALKPTQYCHQPQCSWCCTAIHR